MRTAREIAKEVVDGVVTLNADAYDIMDFGVDNLRQLIEDAGEVEIATPDGTDEWEWESLCDRLELNQEKTDRVFRLKDFGTVTALFASSDDYKF